MAEILVDPYEDVDWDTVEYHKSEWHNHIRGDMETAHDLVDMYAGDGPDPAGNTLADGEEYTVLAAGNKGNMPMLWPWTEFSQIDSAYDDRDPQSMGVVAFPAAEIQKPQHMCSIFSTLQDEDIESDFDTSLSEHVGNILSEDGKALPEGENMTIHAHPSRHLDAPVVHRQQREFYPQFADHSIEDGHIGFAAANKESGFRGRDIRLWDKLLTRYAPHRMIWGFGEDDAFEYRGIGEDVDKQITTLLLAPDEFDPSDQSESRQSAAKAFRAGRLVFHDRKDYDATNPPTLPHINSISIDGLTITVGVENRQNYTIHWFSNGAEVGRGSDFDVTDEHFPYVRAEIRGESATTYTQPWGVQASRTETGDAMLGDVQS